MAHSSAPPRSRAASDLPSTARFAQRHLLGIEHLSRDEIVALLDLADEAVTISRQVEKKRATLRGRTQINLFFEASTRTQSSFELAGKRLGADVMNMAVGASSVNKGETLIDTAMTLNAMRPDIWSCAIIRPARCTPRAKSTARSSTPATGPRASDPGVARRAHHPPHLGRIEGLTVAICGDILHSRVARSNILLLGQIRRLCPARRPVDAPAGGGRAHGRRGLRDMRSGLKDADIVMMLRLQRERMSGAFVPSTREYFRYFGLDQEKLA